MITTRDAVDFVLDFANEHNAKVTSIKVGEFTKGIYSMYVDMDFTFPIETKSIEVNFIAKNARVE